MKIRLKKRNIVAGIIVLLILFLISIILPFFTSFSILDSLRIVFGSVYVLFLPGLIISFIFFPDTKPFDEDKKDNIYHDSKNSSSAIDLIERIAISFALSIAIVPLVVFYLNLVGIKINLLNSFLTILAIIIISIIILYYKTRREPRNKYL